MKARVLFTSVCTPYDKILDCAATDHMAYRLTRGQDIFMLYEHQHMSPLHMLAQNLDTPSVVLENPSIDALLAEIQGQDYEYICISYKITQIEMLLPMCEHIRRVAPQAKIVIGGSGVLCLGKMFEDPRWIGMIDHICKSEGISFLRDLLGEQQNAPIHCRLPKEGSGLPWLNPRPPGTIGIVLSALGCTKRCPFCATTAITSGKYLEVMDADAIFEAMKNYWDSSPFTSSLTIYDENFLDYRNKVLALGKRIQEDTKAGLAQLNYAAFGSISALAKYTPDELLLSGVDTVWIGVESKFTGLKKRRGASTEDTFAILHRAGIKTIGSWIIGEDYQTPENIEEDSEFFISLDATFQQLSILTVMPALPIWHLRKKRGLLPETVDWKDYHLYGNTFHHPTFTHQEMLDHVEQMYHRIYATNGSALLKVLAVNMNGYEYCGHSSNALLRTKKRDYFRRRCESYRPLIRTAIEHAPSRQVQARMETLEQRYIGHFGPPTPSDRRIEETILARATRERERREREPQAVREEPYRRYRYACAKDRSPSRPYQVDYPESHVRQVSDGFPMKEAVAG